LMRAAPADKLRAGAAGHAAPITLNANNEAFS